MSTLNTEDQIVRKVPVNRGRSPQEAIEATGRTQDTYREVVDAMPKGEGDEVEVVFFKLDLSQHNAHISNADLSKEFELRRLKPADPVSVAAVNEVDLTFADEVPHCTHWKDARGSWCYIVFRRWDGEPKVTVCCGDHDWHDSFYFAGIPL